jgi:hypothetical protein
VLLLAIVTVEIKLLDPQIDAIGLMSTISLLRTNSVGASDAIAAEQVGSVQCALRDLRVVTSIEAHGEARDVPADKLGGAFSAMMNARAACAAGHIGEALAIYDSTIVVPAEPTRN